jgi:hypothetical protein
VERRSSFAKSNPGRMVGSGEKLMDSPMAVPKSLLNRRKVLKPGNGNAWSCRRPQTDKLPRPIHGLLRTCTEHRFEPALACNSEPARLPQSRGFQPADTISRNPKLLETFANLQTHSRHFRAAGRPPLHVRQDARYHIPCPIWAAAATME